MTVNKQDKQDKQDRQDRRDERDEREVTIEARYLMAAAECCARGKAGTTQGAILQAIKIKCDGETVRITGTDGFKLARVTRAADGCEPFEVAIPASDLKPMLKVRNAIRFGKVGMVDGKPRSIEVGVVGSDVAYRLRAIDGYPETDGFFKDPVRKETLPFMPSVDAKQLADVCRAASRAYDGTPALKVEHRGPHDPIRFHGDREGTTFDAILMPLRPDRAEVEAYRDECAKLDKTEDRPEPKPDTAKPEAKPKPKAKAASKATPKAVRKVSAAKPQPKPKPKAQAPTFGWLDRPCA